MFTLNLHTHIRKAPTGPLAEILGKYGLFGWLIILIMYNLFLSTLQKIYAIDRTVMTIIIIVTLAPLLAYQFYLAWFFITKNKKKYKMTIHKQSLELQTEPKKKPLRTSIKKLSFRFHHHYRRKKFTGPSLVITIPGFSQDIIIECRCDFHLVQWRQPEKNNRPFNSGHILIDEYAFIELLALLKLKDEIKQYKIRA